MAETSLALRLRGLILSSADLQQLTDWKEQIIEDYLNIVDNITQVAVSIDVGATIDIQNRTGDYTTIKNDGLVLANASLNTVTISLDDTAIAGQSHVIKCIDDTFSCLVGRNGNEIDGVAESFELFRDESISVRADSDNNWWIF